MGVHYASGIELSVFGTRAWQTGDAAPVFGVIRMTGVAQMVGEVLACIGDSRRIAALGVVDQSCDDGFAMGEDQVTMASLAYHAGALARLRPHFAHGAIVHMKHPELGRNARLVSGLAMLLGVPVYAGLGGDGPGQGHDLGGGYICADPHGRVLQTAGRPETFDAGDMHVPAALLARPVSLWSA